MGPEPVRIPKTIKFGEDFELDVESYMLSRAGRVLKLERIPMDILLLLVRQWGQLVDRDQIAEKVWGKGVFLDTDNSINIAISKIRQTLKDDPEEPRFIQTIPGRGYRFIAPVETDAAIETEETVAAPAPQVAENRQPAIAQSSIDKPTNRRWQLAIALAAVLIAVAGIGMRWWRSSVRSPIRSNVASGRAVLAVLPFANLTGDASQDYFSDGLTEEMISRMGNLDPERLAVIARTSVMHYKGSQASLDQIERELGVEYVVEGSVRRDANNVRITAQLIRTSDQTHLWARQYDRELKSLLALQAEIATEIADEVQHTLGDSKPTAAAQAVLSPQNYDAYDLYLKGQYFFNKRTVEGLAEAIGYFEQAATKDPNYARAYAGLADCYALMPGYSGRPQPEFPAKARAAALKALEIDDRLPEAHAALALVVQNYDWDWATAEKQFRRALELNPNDATARHWYAEHLMWRGRFDEALAESERARQLDPLSLIIAADNGAILYLSRQYDGAIKKWQSVREMDPNFPKARMISFAYVEKGMYAEALVDLERQRPMMPGPWYLSTLAYIYGRSGQTAKAQHALEELLQLDRKQPVDPPVITRAYLAVGDKEQALAWLEKAYAQHSHELTGLKVTPEFDPIRSDPRFQELMRKVGLQQ